MIEILLSPGFLGTKATFAADLTLTLMLVVVTLLSIGVYMAVRGKYEVHKWLQTTGVLINLILVLWLMLPSYRNNVLNAQGSQEAILYQVTKLHAAVGLFALLLGNFVMLRGHELVPKRLRFKNYKLFMRTAYGLYLATTLLGAALYYTWYVA